MMFVSTVFASGLYASVYLSQLITVDAPHSSLKNVPPFTPVQASRSDNAMRASAAFVPTSDPFPDTAQFETGDSWVSGGRRHRLYGIQSCLRGTRITGPDGIARDCGELNVVMTQAIIRDTKPACQDVKDIDRNNAVVVCQTTTGHHRYDLATYLIAKGWGFAAIDAQGQLIVPGYRIVEESARSARAGLWASSDLPHPVSVLQQQGSLRP